MKKKDVKIFVSHRIDLDSETVKSPVYVPVRCGAVYDGRENMPDIIGDNSGDNISQKRGSYCELTVQYWAWKNIKAEYYGLCHYRRYLSFSKNEFTREPLHQFQVPEELLSKKAVNKYNLCDVDYINELLKDNDLIIPLPWNVSEYEIPGVGRAESVYDLWKLHEGIMSAPGCMDLLIRIIENKFPQYQKATKEYLSDKYSWSSNCFIMHKKLFNEMCTFEFSVLEELEREIDSSGFDQTMMRTPGYMAEVLSGIFFKHCQLNKCRINQRQLVLFLDTSRDVINAINSKTVIDTNNVSMCFKLMDDRIMSLKEFVTKKISNKIKYKEFWAIKDVSFSVEKGEVIGIIGRNGSGKSTLLKIISGILKPTKGSITSAGVIAPMLELGSGFDPDLTGRENVFLNGAVLGFEKEFLEKKFTEILDFSELGEFINVPIRNYSSGMLMRLAFSIATLIEPDILIVDEILAVGDEAFQLKCRQRMAQMMSGGTTVILVSHSIAQIREMCTRVVWLDQGCIKMIGDTAQVCEAYASFFQ